MKKLTAIAALVLAATVHAKPSDWYTPDGWTEVEDHVTVSYYDEDGNPQHREVTLDADGNIPLADFEAISNDDPLTVLALRSAEKALQAHNEVKAVGKKLDSLATNGLKITGKDANGNKITQTISFAVGPNAEGKALEGDTDAQYDFADGKTIGYTGGTYPKLKLYGAPSAASDKGLIPWWGGSALAWFDPYDLFDHKSIETITASSGEIKNGGIQLAGFAGKDYLTLYNLADYMTNGVPRSATSKDSLSIVVRDGSQDKRIRYMDIGEIAEKVTNVDEVSITKGDDEEEDTLALVGFGDAETAAAEARTAFVPYTSGDGLAWQALDGFFADNVFTKTESGKIILNGVEEGDTETRIITVRGSDDKQSVTTFAADNASIDFEATGGHLQLHGFHDVPGFSVENDVADILTNADVSVEGQYLPIVVGQNGTREIRYAPLAKIDGSTVPDVDGATITINEEDPSAPYLMLHGADAELEDGMVYAIGPDGTGRFVHILGDEAGDSNPSIEIAEDENGNRTARLYGWNNTIEGNGLIGWDENHALKYFEASSFTRGVTLDDGFGLELSRYPNKVGAIPYSTTDTGNGDSLNWLSGDNRIPLLKNGAAPVAMSVGKSLATDGSTLNISGFGSATSGQVPTKNAAGGITWKDAASDSPDSFGSITFVSDVTWDAANHQLKITKTTVSAKITGTPTTVEEVVFTATSHAQEHQE